jgi:Dyp-type peroxidase family
LPDQTLQEGIYFKHRQAPPGFFALLLLDPTPGASATDVAALLDCLWKRYRSLKGGKVEDLGKTRVPGGKLQILLGLGASAFELAGRPANGPARPAWMLQSFDKPLEAGGGPISPGAGISYEADVTENPADAAIAFQFTAETPLAVERAVVETWKLLKKQSSPALEIRAVYAGTKRDDGRSWIDFHDGLSNIAPAERLAAMVVPQLATPGPLQQDAWTSGGTYLAFMRLYIDLALWRTLEIGEQEALVGRQKQSGLPLLSLDPTDKTGKTGKAYGKLSRGKAPHEADPLPLQGHPPLDETIRSSHVQRANHHDPFPGGAATPANHRIFRQGYPFLEALPSPEGFRVGLNFISFQSTPSNLTGMLGQVGWLGNTNFGGDKPFPLLSARAAGFFLVPPLDKTEHFPGERVLTGPPAQRLTGG